MHTGLAPAAIFRFKKMILEVAILDVIESKTQEFEEVFHKAQNIIMSIGGYISHELQKCVEQRNRYILLVRWQSLEDHTIGFRDSLEYQEWKKLLHHFYNPFPLVQHYAQITSLSSKS